MGLEEIQSEILQNAEEKAEEIKEEAEQTREEIIEEAEKEAEEIKEEEKQKLEEQKESYEKKALSNARMKAKQEKMNAKEEKIQEVFEEFKEYLEDLSKTDKSNFAERCIEKVEFDVGKIQGSSEFEDAVSQEFEEKDINGIVVVSEDGARRQEFTFDKITEDFKDQYRRQVAEELF